MNCYVHPERDAVGTCVGCGKFICTECVTEIQGKNYCKRCIGELLAEKNHELTQAKQQAQQQPMVFMNAGGASSSSSASASSSGRSRRGAPPYPTNSVLVHIVLLFLTAGIGNLIYFLYIKGQQNKWNAYYR